MKKTALMVSLGAVLLSSAAQADTLFGVYAGANFWRSNVSGGFGDSEPVQAFNFSDKNQQSYFIAVEHPLPLLPNVRLQHTRLESSGAATLDNTLQFNDASFLANTDVSANVDFTTTDYILYYEVLDNSLVSLDLGINAKHVKGDAAVSQLLVNSSRRVSDVVPMLYSAAKFELPFTGLDLFAQGSYAALDDNSIYDVQAGLAYKVIDNLAVDMRLKLGYRAVNLKLDNADGVYSDLDFKGAFAGIELHF